MPADTSTLADTRAPGSAAVRAPATLRQVVGWLLPGAPAIEPLRTEADGVQLVAMAAAERVLGPLLATIDAGGIELPDHLVGRVVDGHQQAMLWCMQLEQRLLEVADWFAEAGGVEFLVVKGPAVAHLDEFDPSLRAFKDLDLLVHGRDMDRAIAALEAHGAARRTPQRRPGFDRRYIKSIGLDCADGVELDVHRSYTGGPHGFRIPLDRVFADAEPFEVGGATFAAPSRAHRALHAAYHGIVGSARPPLRTLRDLAGHLASPDLTPDVLAAEARLWRGEAVLAEAVRATLSTFAFSAPEWQCWLDDMVVDPAELAIIERGRRPGSRPVEWATVRELGWRDRLAFTWAVAVPSAETLQHRGVTLRHRFVRGVPRLVRAVWRRGG